jgi:hypothetical protein
MLDDRALALGRARRREAYIVLSVRPGVSEFLCTGGG